MDGEVFLSTQDGDSPPPDTESSSVTIRAKGEELATVSVWPIEGNLLTLPETLARDLSERFATAYDLDMMTEELSQSYEELNLLYRLSRTLKADEKFVSSCRNLIDATAELLENRMLIFCLPDEDHVNWQNGTGEPPTKPLLWVAKSRETHRGVFDELIPSNERAHGSIPTRQRGHLKTPHGPVHYFVTPVRGRGSAVGYAGIFRAEDEAPISTGELRLLECLGDQLSLTATTRELHSELRDMLFNTVRSLVITIEAKDAYTRGHSERVYDLSRRIGEAHGLPEEEMQTLSWAALLHDIGKLAVPKEVLCKPGKLTNEEFAIIKTHPERGCLVLEPISQLSDILPGIRHHHERYDGRGYPDGLKGEEIPLLARIISVADTFDAMVSSRPYREARTVEFTLETIRKVAGSQLDPEIVDVFFKLIDDGALEDIARPNTETVDAKRNAA